MNIITAIILGLVQGVTEFLPISSSGHLIIAREILGINISGGLAFDAILQLATSIAVLVYFRKDLWQIFLSLFHKERTLLWAVILATIPAIILGLLLQNYMDTVFRNGHLVAVALIVGALLLWFAQTVAMQDKQLSVGRGVIVGFFQCLALVPGISRSGATISGGLIMGLRKEEAIRFSFLLSFPILFGSGLKKLFDVRDALFVAGFGVPLFVASLVAFITGLFAIKFLIKYLQNHNFNIFIWYRIILALVILLWI